MVKKIDLLRDLQEIDTELDGVRQRLEQCRARLGDDSELIPLRDAMEESERRLKSLQDAGSRMDRELEERTARVKAGEKKLYGGTVKSPKDLSSLAEEVAHERERMSQLEDRILANMDAVDAATGAADAARSAYAEREMAWKAQQATLEAECRNLSGQEEELERRRGEAASRIDPATLRTYESIRRARGGLAVVPIEQRTCKGCRISLSSSEVQRARSSPDLVFCQSCGRILYVP